MNLDSLDTRSVIPIENSEIRGERKKVDSSTGVSLFGGEFSPLGRMVVKFDFWEDKH